MLAYDLREQIEEKVLRGEHEEAEKFDGILELAAEIVTTSTLAPDIISEGIAVMTALGYNPAFVVLHPLDAHRLRTLKAEGGSEEYLSGGSWSNSTGQNVWNTPVVESPALTQGEALLVDPAFVKVLDREEVQVAISSEDRDNLIKRLVTLAGWARFGVAVFDTHGVGKLNLPVPSP